MDLPGADHTTISIELEHSMKVVQSSIAYFDSLIKKPEELIS